MPDEVRPAPSPILMKPRSAWRRVPGNPYASDATYEVAVVLASNRRCWQLVDKAGLRDEDGKVDPVALQLLMEAGLRMYGLARVDLREVDWGEVAAEFAVEVGPERSDDKEKRKNAPEMADEPRRTGDPTRAIPLDVLSVLQRSTASLEAVFLPSERLDRPLYARVNDVLEAAGGKWDRRVAGHIFPEDARAVLEAVQATGRYVDPKQFGFFPTPAEVGRLLIEAADLQPGMAVLEPSAGHGSLADLAAGICGSESVSVVELLEANRRVLQDKGYRVIGSDFLAMQAGPDLRFDRIIMNPPFANLADVDHVQHAARFLRPGGRLVAIMSPSHTFRDTHKASAFRDLLALAGEQICDLPAGAFRASGTNVRSVIVSIHADRLPQAMRPEAFEAEDGEDPADAVERPHRGG